MGRIESFYAGLAAEAMAMLQKCGCTPMGFGASDAAHLASKLKGRLFVFNDSWGSFRSGIFSTFQVGPAGERVSLVFNASSLFFGRHNTSSDHRLTWMGADRGRGFRASS
jgi:hypothetical protein